MFSAPAHLSASEKIVSQTGDHLILPSLSTVMILARGEDHKREISRSENFSAKMLKVLQNILKCQNIFSSPILYFEIRKPIIF